MRKSLTLLILAVTLIFTACKNGNKKQQNVNPDRETVSITHSLGTIEVPVNPKRIVVLHFASLENLDLIDANVVGIPKLAVPKYLNKYATDESITNVGSLVEVNLEKINELEPDLILSGGRLSDSYDALSKIAPTLVASFDMEDPLRGLKKDLNDLGEIFESQEVFDKVYTDLEEKINNRRAKIEGSKKEALVVLHNKGRFSAYGSGSRFGLIHDLMGVNEAAEGLDTHLHGTRASSEFIQETNPDVLFIVDRSAAIGDQPLNRGEVENELIQRTKAYENGKIVYLNPEAWYLSGTGGITAINIMVDEVSEAFEDQGK